VPFVPGAEVVGRDPDGSRVAALVAGGGYAGRAVAVREAVVPVPDEVDDASALVLLLQAATAYHVLRTSAALRQGESVVVMAGAGELRTVVGGTYSLSEARRAHEDLRARRTTGKLVLDPSR
jgi:NADPH2:quinone reductase